MRLYDKDGWLDVPHIAKICDRNGINFIVIIGKRQVGKTYNTLKYMLDYKIPFIFMRTTKTELDMITAGANSPFEKIKDYTGRIRFKSEGEYSSKIYLLNAVSDSDGDSKEEIGKAVSLSTVGKIRGFNGDPFTDVVYDEFIPESHLLRLKTGGTIFESFHDTANGNREMEGRPCIRCWLLANSNDLNNDILDKFNLTKIIERMSIRGDEYHMDTKRGYLVLMPDSTQIVEQRKKGGLYRMIGTDSQYARMALGNEFSFNDYSDVQRCALQEYNPLITIGRITIHLHKNNKTLYVTARAKAKARYTLEENETHIRKFNRDFSDIKAAFMRGRIYFEDMSVKIIFLNIIGL